MISVLFVQKNSVYKSLTDSRGEPLDCWDEERDAMKWPGGNPVIAHPPCRLWSRYLRHLSTAPESEKGLAIWAVKQVREYGGVLEHPGGSLLWQEVQIPLPGRSDSFGFCQAVNQFWWGHKGTKPTWLYICGHDADLDIPFKLGQGVNLFKGAADGRYVPGSRHSGIRSATPFEFAKWLVQVAETCHGGQRVQLF